MKFFLGIATLFLLGFSPTALCQEPYSAEPDGVRWLENIPAATKLAEATGRPMLLVFR